MLLCTAITNVIGYQTNSFDNIIVLEFSFSEPIFEKTNIDENIFTAVSINNLSKIHDLGKPILPVKSVRVLLPQGTDIENIEISSSEEIILGFGFNIKAEGYVVPISKIINEDNKPEISAISFNSLYSYVGVYTFRGFSILHLNLHPIQYDASNGKISYYNSMKLIVETKNGEINKALEAIQMILK